MKYKLNPDQSMIKKLNDLNPTDRDHYIASLSKQAINNIVSYVLFNPSKWIHTPHIYREDEVDLWTNKHLNATVCYNKIEGSLSYHTGFDSDMTVIVAKGGSTQ